MMAREWLNMIWGNASGALYQHWREAHWQHPAPRGWMWWACLPRSYYN